MESADQPRPEDAITEEMIIDEGLAEVAETFTRFLPGVTVEAGDGKIILHENKAGEEPDEA